MKRWPACVSLIFGILCAPVWAQQPVAECSPTPPDHKVDRNGNVLPEYREWDWGQCPPGVQQQASGGLVSVRSLRYRPLKAARKEFDRGVKAWRKGESKEAEHHLAEAVRLDSRFLEAQVELGAIYAQSGQLVQALDYFNGALALEPKSAEAYAGKASVLVMLNRAGEAEQAARHAIELGPGLIAAHYMLGTALLMQEKLTPEAAAHLEIAANKYPRARAFLESLQRELGRNPAQ